MGTTVCQVGSTLSVRQVIAPVILPPKAYTFSHRVEDGQANQRLRVGRRAANEEDALAVEVR